MNKNILEDIQNFSIKKLKPVPITITHLDGTQIVQYSLYDDVNNSVTKRKFGFVVDNSADLEVAVIVPGSQDIAQNRKILRKHKITHILNVATGVKNLFNDDIQYKTLNICDYPSFPIHEFFESSIEFIKCGMEHGTVLVHCNAGVSRSVTIVIAFLMHTLGMSVDDALRFVKTKRQVSCPNEGFMKQLYQYELKLRNSTSLS